MLMNMLDKFKSAIFEEDVAPTPTAPAGRLPTRALLQQQAPTTPYTVAAPLSTPNGTVPAVPKHMKQTLLDELAKNIVGSPYLQFQKINTSMKLKIGDTATRCMAIGASLDAQGITKQSLLDGANQAKQFLTQEATNFQADVNSNINNLEQQYQTKIAQIATTLEQKQNQIKALSDDISALQKEKSSLDLDVQANKTKFEVSKIEFTGALDSVLQEISTDINDITVYLGV